MTEREIVLASAGHELAGTLLLPDARPPLAAALLLPGSGPVDRNEDHGKLPLGVTRLLAGALAEAGAASFRYDKRGVGASPGDWRAAGMSDEHGDARAALGVLAAQPEVDPGRIAVVGHSAGAFHAARLAAEDGRLRAAVLLAGAARDGDAVLRWQAAAIQPTLPRAVRLLLRLQLTDLPRRQAATIRALRASTRDVARIGGARLNAGWLREFLDWDPRADLVRARVPVLAITGEHDLQVPPEDLEVMARLLGEGGETYLAPGVSHVLRRVRGRPSLTAYRREAREPLAADVVERVVRWVVDPPPLPG
ncbi:MAG: alpha/beta hydrolase [Thermoleophilia bacterium]